MASRWNREEFFAKIDDMDEADLKKALWTLYLRGAAPVRQRIEELVDPQLKESRKREKDTPPDAQDVLVEVEEFASLARSGAYLAGNRQVSTQERSRWRFTFRRLAREAQEALRGTDTQTATTALATLIDLACEAEGTVMFRSEDPVEAARFVVSDAVVAMWSRYRDEYGHDNMLKLAVEHMLRWEKPHGWTRFGDGWVAEKETTLTNALAGFLKIPDLWTAAGRYYLDALDQADQHSPAKKPNYGSIQEHRAAELGQWHGLLIDHLAGSADAEVLDRLVTHEQLAGQERTILQARLAAKRGDTTTASKLVERRTS